MVNFIPICAHWQSRWWCWSVAAKMRTYILDRITNEINPIYSSNFLSDSPHYFLFCLDPPPLLLWHSLYGCLQNCKLFNVCMRTNFDSVGEWQIFCHFILHIPWILFNTLYCNKAVRMSILLWLSNGGCLYYHIFLLTFHLSVTTQFTDKKQYHVYIISALLIIITPFL